jgi:SAM-dependent methyltransferase
MVEANQTRSHAMAVRIWRSCLATQEQFAAYLGVKLGLYEQLGTPATAAELAARAGIAPRYAREWLEQQAMAGFIDVARDDPRWQERSYVLPPEHRTVLTISDSPDSLAAMAILPIGAVAAALPSLLAAWRDGTGVSDAVYGDDWRLGHSGTNRSLFARELAGWIRRLLPDAHYRLARGGGRIADVGCGAGWASIALAAAYPLARVDGFDLDAGIVELAALNADAAGLTDTVRFTAKDVGVAPPGAYQLVCVFDALHEMARPVEVLAECRRLRAEDGVVIVLDARVADEFAAPGDEVERFQYATSVLHCLPAGLADSPSAGTGTAMRADEVRDYARRAGFARVTELPIEDRFHRLYRLAE